MRTLLTISRGLEALVNGVGRVASWLFLLLIALIIVDVITRKYGFQIPGFGSTKLQEAEWHTHAVLFLFCLGMAYLKDAHVRIDLVRDRMGARVQSWIEIIGCLIFLIPYACLVLYYGYDFVLRAWNTGERSSALTGLDNRWAIKASLLAGFLLLLLAGLSILFKRLVFLFRPELLAQDERRGFDEHHEAHLSDELRT